MATSDKLELLQQELAERVEALRSGEQWRRMLDFASRLHNYSFSNILLIDAQWRARLQRGEVGDPAPGSVAGYGTWRALGRNVIRGQKGLAIIAPTVYQQRSAKQPDGSIRPLGNAERPGPGEELVEGEPTVRGFKIEYVFSVAQTEGEPLPSVPRPQQLSGTAPAGLINGLIDYARDRGFTVERVGSAKDLDGADGRTNFTERIVAVRTDMDEAAAATTLLHEIGHVLLHDPSRDGARVVHRGIGEVEAESVAYIVSAAHGLDTSTDSLPYVAGWLGTTGNAQTVAATASRVVRAAHHVLSALGTVQFGDGRPPGTERLRHPGQAGEPPEIMAVEATRAVELSA